MRTVAATVALLTLLAFPAAAASSGEDWCTLAFQGTVQDAGGVAIPSATVHGPGRAIWTTDLSGRYEGEDRVACDVDRIALTAYFEHGALDGGVARHTVLVKLDDSTAAYTVVFTLAFESHHLTGHAGFLGDRILGAVTHAVVAVVGGFLLTGGYRLRDDEDDSFAP